MTEHTKGEPRTLQTWPIGKSYTFRGDVHDDMIEIREGDTWRTATADEHRQIKIAVLAEMYADRDVLACDSVLVDDLIKAAMSGELSGDLTDAFSYDEIRGLYADPSDWDAEQCREYAEENGVDLPDAPISACPDCDGTGEIGEDPAVVCGVCKGSGEVPEDGYEEDDSLRGWLAEAREACRDYAQDNPAEVFEWWRVSSWLCAKLNAIGEVTIDNSYGYWWGRTCTEQGFIMDGTLQRIAARFID